MANLQPKQFTHTVEQKDGGWSGSVTPFAATSAAHAKAMIEKSGTHKVTTGVSPKAFASGQYRETDSSATRKVMENSKMRGGKRVLKSTYPHQEPHF